MKLIAVLICFFFMASANAEYPNFKVLKPDEYKKLSKPQQIEYLKEFAKRVGTPSKRKPARSSSNHQPSKLQMVLADILGLPMAAAEEDITTRNNKARKEAEERYKKQQEEIAKRTKDLTVDTDKKAQLEAERIRLGSKKSVEDSEIERKISGFNTLIEEKEKAIKANSEQINKVQSEIRQLESVNNSLNEQLGADGAVAIQRNSDRIELLNERLKGYTQREKDLTTDTIQLRKETAALGNSSRDPKLQESLKANDEKLSAIEAQLKERDAALKKMADLNKSISAQSEKVADNKKAIEKLEAQRESLKQERENDDLSGAERESLTTRIEAINAEIKRKEGDIEATKIDARRSTFALDNLAKRAGVEVKVDENLNVKLNETKNKNAQLTNEDGKSIGTTAQQARMNAICSRPNLTEEQQATCAMAQGKATVVGGANGPAAKVTGGANGPAAKVTGGANAPTGKPGDVAKPVAPTSIDKAAELCPNAGFIVMLDETRKDAACPSIHSADQDGYVGKITQGPAAKASCKNNKDYSVEQSVLCQPLLFGLTSNDNGICVAPGQDVSKRCHSEATNKKSFDKAWETVKANKKAFEEWIKGYEDMCLNKVTTNTARRPDTLDTCKSLELVRSDLEEAKKRDGKPATPAAKPAAAPAVGTP